MLRVVFDYACAIRVLQFVSGLSVLVNVIVVGENSTCRDERVLPVGVASGWRVDCHASKNKGVFSSRRFIPKDRGRYVNVKCTCPLLGPRLKSVNQVGRVLFAVEYWRLGIL